MSEAKQMEMVRLYNLNIPIPMLQNKYGLNGAEVITILHKFVVNKDDN